MKQVIFQQMSSYSGGQSARNMSGGLPGRSVDDPRMMGIVDPGPVKERVLGLGSGRPEVPLPPGATSTLFVEGLPANCTRREVARILLCMDFGCLSVFLPLHFTFSRLFPSPCLKTSFARLLVTKK